jgi:hypothetical protein
MGLEGRLTCSVSTRARGLLAIQRIAGRENGGELSKHPTAGLYLANGTATGHHGA